MTEISAVCTAPEARGPGHAARLVRALAARIAPPRRAPVPARGREHRGHRALRAARLRGPQADDLPRVAPGGIASRVREEPHQVMYRLQADAR
ncbi:GNAT family N-acetyltransferase [Actinomadura napierensis]|uniref:GNAT family N-acetyltransferase n=1 Tax=Actinomadura napierensis TaxID=267854 RepID=UPI0031D96741